MLEETLLILATGILNIVCFFVGVKAGQKEKIEMPNLSKLNPVNTYVQRRERHEEKKKSSEFEKILENLERYNGTEEGQEDIE